MIQTTSAVSKSVTRLFAGVGVCVVTFAIVPSAFGQGRIIAVGDEWLVSDTAYTNQPAQTQQLVSNIAGYFSNSGPANFAVFPGSPIAYGSSIAAHMATLGHTWNTAPGVFTLANLQTFDGVFLAGFDGSGAANAPILTQYVQGGGRVMVMAGTGAFGNAASEAVAWDPFLNAFGLGFGSEWFPGSSVINLPVNPTSHPLGSLLSTVTWGYGQTALDLDGSNPANEVAAFGDFTAFGGGSNVPFIATYNLPEPESMIVLAGAAGALAAMRRRR